MAPSSQAIAHPVGAAGVVSQTVSRITLIDFRSFREVRLEAEPRSVVLTGPNGAGKTNLLEALSFLAPGRGLRRARLKDVARHGAEGPWGVAAKVITQDGPVDIGTGLASRDSGEGGDTPPAMSSGDTTTERRIVKIDGAVAKSQAVLASVLTVDWLTPLMDRLFVDGASGRRRFLDRLVNGLDAEHALRVSAYERALRERARLLDEAAGEAAWLDALEETLSRHGVAIAAARRETVARLAQILDSATGPFPRAHVRVAGDVEDWLGERPAVEVEARLRAAFRDARPRDARTGTAAAGPQRSDLGVRHGDHGTAAEMCSTGEQKALLIALVLAGVRMQAGLKGTMPILLLDEVAAHLDRARREALFEEICELGVQAWLTGTDRVWFAPLEGRAQFCEVGEGRISRPESRV